MNNVSIKLICLFIMLIFINGCTGLKDGLTGAKKKNIDEFLVKKKNPLVLPPKFGELPIPQALNKKTEEEIDFDIMNILGKVSSESKAKSKTKIIDYSTEKSIMKKINKN